MLMRYTDATLHNLKPDAPQTIIRGLTVTTYFQAGDSFKAKIIIYWMLKTSLWDFFV